MPNIRSVRSRDHTSESNGDSSAVRAGSIAVAPAPRPVPATGWSEAPGIERTIIDSAMGQSGGYDALVQYLKDNGYALVISRNVTRRADDQQPYNLGVPGGAAPGGPASSGSAAARTA